MMRLLALCVAAASLLIEPGRQVSDWSQVAPGVEYQRFPNPNVIVGPTRANHAYHVLRVDPRQVDLQIVHALDQAVGLETVSSMAARYGAIAAVNGGFFRTTGTYRGDSMGAPMIDGELLSEPDRQRAVVALIRTPDGVRAAFGHARADISISDGKTSRPVNGLNRPREPDELIVYTPQFHGTTLTTPDGVEAIVRRDRVERLVDPGGSQRIPTDGFVISGHGDGAAWLRSTLRAGSLVTLTRRLQPVDAGSSNWWATAEDVLGAGPQLLKDGRVDITAGRESMSASLATERHPRTAIGATSDGRVLLAVVDGRRPEWSDGMLLEELAGLMRSLGAVDAINLDGGGSSTMVLQGNVANRPSDEAGERPVGDGILVLPRKR